LSDQNPHPGIIKCLDPILLHSIYFFLSGLRLLDLLIREFLKFGGFLVKNSLPFELKGDSCLIGELLWVETV
jgi:hypothetical protein